MPQSRVGPTARVTSAQTEISKPPVAAPALTRANAMPVPEKEIPQAKSRHEEAQEAAPKPKRRR